MAQYLAIRDGGKTDQEGAFRWLRLLFNSECVLSADSLLCHETAGTQDRNVQIDPGDCLILTADALYHCWSDDNPFPLLMPTNTSGNPRIDAVLGYVDTSVVDPTNPNNPGAFILESVTGTPASSPVAPTDGEIDSALSNEPWLRLCNVYLSHNYTQIFDADITDTRTFPYMTFVGGYMTYNPTFGIWAFSDNIVIPNGKFFFIQNSGGSGGGGFIMDGADTFHIFPGAGGETVIDGAVTPRDNTSFPRDTLNRDRYTEVDVVIQGGALPTSGTRTHTISAMTIVVKGRWLEMPATAHTYSASKDFYVDCSWDGVYTFIEQTIAATPPAVTANSHRIGFGRTNGSAITNTWSTRNFQRTAIDTQVIDSHTLNFTTVYPPGSNQFSGGTYAFQQGQRYTFDLNMSCYMLDAADNVFANFFISTPIGPSPTVYSGNSFFFNNTSIHHTIAMTWGPSIPYASYPMVGTPILELSTGSGSRIKGDSLDHMHLTMRYSPALSYTQ